MERSRRRNYEEELDVEPFLGDIDVDEVRAHLRNLGFKNIPQDVLDEFIQDLQQLKSENNSPASSVRSNSKQVKEDIEDQFDTPLLYYSSHPKNERNSQQIDIQNRSYNKSQPQSQEKKENRSIQQYDYEKNIRNRQPQFRNVDSQNEFLNSPIQFKSTSTPTSPSDIISHSYSRPSTANSTMSNTSSYSNTSKSGSKTPRYYQTNYHLNYVPQKTYKKSDPVSNYHSMQNVWKSDRFLQTLDKPRKLRVIYPPPPSN